MDCIRVSMNVKFEIVRSEKMTLFIKMLRVSAFPRSFVLRRRCIHSKAFCPTDGLSSEEIARKDIFFFFFFFFLYLFSSSLRCCQVFR